MSSGHPLLFYRATGSIVCEKGGVINFLLGRLDSVTIKKIVLYTDAFAAVTVGEIARIKGRESWIITNMDRSVGRIHTRHAFAARTEPYDIFEDPGFAVILK